MPSEPFYDPEKSYLDNFEHGPFGLFAETSPASQIKEPKHQFLGQPVSAPFGIPAGPLINGTFVKAALDMGFDIPVYKTVRTRRYECHPWPNVLAVKVEGDLGPDRTLVADHDYSEPLSITNSFGVPSFDPEFWQRDMADAAAYARPGQVVVGSFQGTLPENGSVAAYIADFVLGARLVKETGVKVPYHVGTMIELPRAALRAGEIAESAEFFSFGTNDLTQATMGLSRDDAGKLDRKSVV